MHSNKKNDKCNLIIMNFINYDLFLAYTVNLHFYSKKKKD